MRTPLRSGTSADELMLRAGEAALRGLRSRWPTAANVAVVTGGGNNGGDGYVLARFAREAGLAATVLAAVPPEKLQGRGAPCLPRRYGAAGGAILRWDAEQLAGADLVVDALLGTGLTRAVRPELVGVIDAINACGHPVFALDLPSGLNADDGTVMGAAVRADCTISFVALKAGLFLGEGPQYTGRLLFDDLGVAAPDTTQFRPVLERLSDADIARALPARRREANKGDFGRVLIGR